MKKSRTLGIFYVFLSAVVFGFTPVLANLSYAGGNNGVNMAFLRSLIPLPLLFVLGRVTAPGYRPTSRQWKRGLLLGLYQFGCTLMLYSSYSYIPVGIATTLHFLYPLLVVLYHVVRFRERPGPMKIVGLGLGMAGAASLLEMGEGGLHPVGVTLALLSAFAFAAYLIVLQQESGDPLPLYRLTTATSLSGCALCIAVGLGMGKLALALTPAAWVYAIITAFAVTIGGTAVFQAGVRIVGDADAAIYSLFEPITSIVFGLILLGEVFTTRKAVSCVLILVGLLLTALADRKK